MSSWTIRSLSVSRTSRGTSPRAPVRIPLGALLCLALGSGAFYLLAYNSGYGYDQPEYLVLGRSLAEGRPFYTFYPVKGPGIYAVTAGLLALGVPLEHAGLAAAVALVFALLVGATWGVLCQTYDHFTGLVGGFLVAGAAALMELNYLETEGFVFLGGLGAYWLLLGHRRQPPGLRLVAAGFLIGTAAHFKTVALFYAGGAGIWLAVSAIGEDGPLSGVVRHLSAFALGLVLGVGGPALYFAATDRLADWWRWSVTFPLFDLPPENYYLGKFLTKLLAFHLLFVAAIVAAATQQRLRQAVVGDPGALLALLMGVSALPALLKSQASHYYFPAAGFLAIFSAIVARALTSSMRLDLRFPDPRAAAVLAILSLLVASGLCYRPDAVSRFTGLKDFSGEERALAVFVQAHVAQDQRLLVLSSGTLLYWLSHRYPPPGILTNDHILAWHLRNRREVVARALSDPAVKLVEYNPAQPLAAHTGFGSWPDDPNTSDWLRAEVERQYVRLSDGPSGYAFWAKKHT